ncbi:MAG: hypothetical protein HXY34_12190 [Candidatus Thorarchaeota archaeon]|nr:hypothetical protein [Candidatus Thorarchaeota archaeon]
MSERQLILNGLWKREAVNIREVPSSWAPTAEQRRLVERAWQDASRVVYDGPVWRFEGVLTTGKDLHIRLSRCSYKWHYVLKEQQYPTPSHYPNPASVTSLVVTEDRKIPVAVRQGPDQGNRLHSLGAGFIDAVTSVHSDHPSSWNFIPENIFDTAVREVQEESTIQLKDIDSDAMALIGAAWGSNHDTTFVIVVPVSVTSDAVGMRGDEHSTLHFVPTDRTETQRVVERGALCNQANDVPATDHLVLALQLIRDSPYCVGGT